jgi:hypothetical protein
MKTNRLMRGLIVFVVFLAMSTITLSARAQLAPDFLVGRWNGFAQSMMIAGSPAGEVTFDVFMQSGRRFEGIASFTGNPENFHIVGTLSGDNFFIIQGQSRGGQHIVARGRLQALGDGSVRIVAAMFKLFDADGNLLDDGLALLVQNMGGADWANLKVPAVQGNWAGDTLSFFNKMSGRLDFMVGPEDQMGSGFCAHGTFFLPYLERQTFMFNFDGTVGLPAVQDGASHFGAIGADTHGIIAILIGLLVPAVQTGDGSVMPPMFTGRYMLYNSFFDVFTDVFFGRNRSFDAGSFSLPAVQ